jgi:acetyltransferase-like isoleucine patch superfamily enzyme
MHLGERFYTHEELAAAGFRSLGINVKIKRNCGLFFTENMIIDDHARIDDFTVIVASREEVRLGKHTHIGTHVFISGSDGFIAEDFVGISAGTKIYSSSDDYTGQKLTNPTLPRQYIGGPAGRIVLQKHVIIGANCVILPGVTIETGTSLGAMTLVNKSLPPWGIYVGAPARKLRDRSQKMLELEKDFQRGEAI